LSPVHEGLNKKGGAKNDVHDSQNLGEEKTTDVPAPIIDAQNINNAIKASVNIMPLKV